MSALEKKQRTVVPRLLLLAAAALFSTGGVAVKGCDLTVWQLASFRSGIAAVLLLLILPSSRRLGSGRVWLVGLAFAATMILYVAANKLTTAANSIYLQSTAPLYVVLLSPWLLKERLRAADLVFLLGMGAALFLFLVGYDKPSQTAPDPDLGNLFGVLSGLTWALTILGLRWLGRRGSENDAPAAVAAGSLITFLVALPFAFPLIAISGTDALLVSYLGVFQIGLAYVFLTRGVRDVPAVEVSLLLLAEPVLNPLFSWLVHDETPSSTSLLACSIILVATGFKAIHEGRSPKKL